MNKVAPNFEVALLEDSRTLQLSDHAGKTVVLNFWESTSKPSHLGIPEFRKVIQKFSPAEVAFVAINQGETATTMNRFLAAKKWNSVDIAMDYAGDAAKQMKVSGIPHLTVLDREGTVRFIKVGYSPKNAEQLEAEIRKLLAE